MGADHATTGRIEHLWMLGIAAVAVAGSFLLRFSDDGSLVLPLPWLGVTIPLPQTCLSRSIFGISCPGCCLTRSFVAMGHGDLHGAFLANPVGPVIYLLCLLQAPYRLVEYFGLGPSNAWWTAIKGRMDLVLWALLAALFVQWVVRML